MKEVACDICGETVEEWKTKPINLGRRVLKLCPECYKTGRRQVQAIEGEKFKEEAK